MVADRTRHATRLPDRLWPGRRYRRTVVARTVPHTVDRQRSHIFVCNGRRHTVSTCFIGLDMAATAEAGFDRSLENA